MQADVAFNPDLNAAVPGSPQLANEFEATLKLANSALALATAHLTPPNPNTYEFWYTYVDGQNTELKDQADSLLDKGPGNISGYDIEQLCDEYIRKEEAQQDIESEASAELSNELKTMREVLKNYLEQSESFSDTLAVSTKDLSSLSTVEQITKAVQCVLAENERMQRETSGLRSSVKKSQNQITTLEARLEKAREVSLCDPLTKLHNRRHYDKTLPKFIFKASLDGRPLCLAVADIDHFKRINDTFGHHVGDGVLKLFSDLLSKSVKGRDLVARYGGEEFVIVLPETTMEDAFTLVEKIRENLQGMKLAVRKTGEVIGNVTASFGIAQLQDADDKESLFERADALLYQAKEAGRNRVVVSGA